MLDRNTFDRGAGSQAQQRGFASARATAWIVVLICVCVLGWRDSYRMVSNVWLDPGMCSGIPSFERLTARLPPNSDVIFVGPAPPVELEGEYFQFVRRFFCIQYVLAPAVVHFVYTPSLLTNDLAGTADVFVLDLRRDSEETRRRLHVLASRRSLSINEESLGTDLVVATLAQR